MSMEKIIIISENNFLNIKDGHKVIIDNIMKLMYFMFEYYPRETYFSIHTRDSIKCHNAIEIVLRWEDLNQPERSKREDVKYENSLDYELGLHERFNEIEKDIHRKRCGALNTMET